MPRRFNSLSMSCSSATTSPPDASRHRTDKPLIFGKYLPQSSCDVVALRTEHDDWGRYFPKVNGLTIRCLDASGGDVVADEQLIDNELNLLGIQIDMAAPPALEFEIAIRLAVDFRIDVVLLGPERVRGIHVLEVLDEPRPVELAAAEVAGERGQPASTEQAARITHRVLAADTRPVGQRRAGDDQGAKQLRPQRGKDHDRPAGLTVADHARLAVGFRMERDDFLDEYRLGSRDVLDGLARHRFGQEADEVAGVAGFHRHADLAVGLEAANSRTMTGARIDHDKRTTLVINLDATWWSNTHESIVHR